MYDADKDTFFRITKIPFKNWLQARANYRKPFSIAYKEIARRHEIKRAKTSREKQQYIGFLSRDWGEENEEKSIIAYPN